MKMPVETLIHREIKAGGAISFARFMELALYCPESGFYETKRDKIGRRGDFYTSVSVGNLFGEMLAFQFSEWLEALAFNASASASSSGAAAPKRSEGGQPSTLNLIEAGAHDGKLAKDILNWLKSNRPKLFSMIHYFILEPSQRRQEWQRETLKDFRNVRWLSRFNDSTIQRFNGILFSNELLDAFSVRRFGWDATAKVWFEWGVALERDKFIWARMAGSCHPSLVTRHVPRELEAVLPDGYVVEVSEAAENWWREAATILGKGKLLTIDYGLTGDEQFSPGRTNGTLRAYYQHHPADDVLANTGEQDLTAHVNFSAIQKVGESAGLKTELFSTQTIFLTHILEKMTKDKSYEWDNSRTRQFQTLTHPEHLGRAFRVLVQSR